jgi:hypothetical protein
MENGSYLAISSPKPRDHQSGDDLVRVFGRGHDDMADKAHQVTQDEEPAPTKQIRVGATKTESVLNCVVAE